MSLFPSANDFKSGPGVEKDAPRKTYSTPCIVSNS